MLLGRIQKQDRTFSPLKYPSGCTNWRNPQLTQTAKWHISNFKVTLWKGSQQQK